VCERLASAIRVVDRARDEGAGPALVEADVVVQVRPGYRAAAYDTLTKRKAPESLQDTRRSLRLARQPQTDAAKGVGLAGAPQTVRDVAEPLVVGIIGGAIRTRSGDPL